MKGIKKKSIIEALLFVNNEPITPSEFSEVIEDADKRQIKQCVEELNQEYLKNNRCFQIEEIAGGWQIRTKPQFSKWIKKMLKVQHRERLSAPALETLAIIAYRQPVTKVEIEEIRGVNADYILHSLVDRGLIRIVGRKDVAGKPFLYGTTKEFLGHFGLSSLKELPDVEELKPKKYGGDNGAKKVAQGNQQSGQENSGSSE